MSRILCNLSIWPVVHLKVPFPCAIKSYLLACVNCLNSIVAQTAIVHLAFSSFYLVCIGMKVKYMLSQPSCLWRWGLTMVLCVPIILCLIIYMLLFLVLPLFLLCIGPIWHSQIWHATMTLDNLQQLATTVHRYIPHLSTHVSFHLSPCLGGELWICWDSSIT